MGTIRSLALAGRRTLCRFLANRDGSVMTWIGVSILPLLISVGMATDISRGFLMRSKLNTALDAAALAGGRDLDLPENERNATIQRYFQANLPPGFMNATISPLDIRLVRQQGEPDRLEVTARAEVPSLFMRLVGIDLYPVAVNSEITVASRSVEVALALDVTGSMSGQRLVDLKAAAKELIDIVVQNSQTPFHSKVALAPYSMAVNAGPWAATVRGAIPGPVSIEDVTRSNPVRVTTETPHGFIAGQEVHFSGLDGMNQINHASFTVANPTATTFELENVDGRFFTRYRRDGIVGGVCQGPGCTFNEYESRPGPIRTHLISTCVSERTGPNAFTDVAPTGGPSTLVGTVYPNAPFASPDTTGGLNPCLSSVITPLSSDKALLKSEIDTYVAEGSTAGAIGNAWAWYLLSDNFGGIFPADSRPGPNDPQELLKAAVLMTDGDFNTIYCNGIIARDATSGSGQTAHRNSCNAPNGSPDAQANAYCNAMKNDGIIVFTVGLGFATTPPASNPVMTCASDASRVFLVNNGADLRQAFREIGLSISKLRLSR